MQVRAWQGLWGSSLLSLMGCERGKFPPWSDSLAEAPPAWISFLSPHTQVSYRGHMEHLACLAIDRHVGSLETYSQDMACSILRPMCPSPFFALSAGRLL